jgi:uncharacterized lipoprotein
MKKILIALSLVAVLAGCNKDESSSSGSSSGAASTNNASTNK